MILPNLTRKFLFDVAHASHIDTPEMKIILAGFVSRGLHDEVTEDEIEAFDLALDNAELIK